MLLETVVEAGLNASMPWGMPLHSGVYGPYRGVVPDGCGL